MKPTHIFDIETRKPDPGEILVDGANFDHSQLDSLMPQLYQDLHRLAVSQMRRERLDHTLQPTALIHQVYLHLIDQMQIDWRGRAYFLALCARVMRQILLDHARRHLSKKKGGGKATPANADIALQAISVSPRAVQLIDLDEALTQLAQADPRSASVVELRYFGGLSNEEIASVLGVSTSTVMNDWSFARAQLRCRLELNLEHDGGRTTRTN